MCLADLAVLFSEYKSANSSPGFEHGDSAVANAPRSRHFPVPLLIMVRREPVPTENVSTGHTIQIMTAWPGNSNLPMKTRSFSTKSNVTADRNEKTEACIYLAVRAARDLTAKTKSCKEGRRSTTVSLAH